jgi:23S rRNA pseudouridine1911/1915/1917 synthase
VALVQGLVAEGRGEVDAPIGRSTRTPTKMAVSAQGRRARTTYTVLRRYEDPEPASLILAALETGRTHQIRVHLSAIGHPVVGDVRYGATAGPEGLDRDRVFLHAARLAFAHPSTGARTEFASPLPSDLLALLADVPAAVTVRSP